MLISLAYTYSFIRTALDKERDMASGGKYVILK